MPVKVPQGRQNLGRIDLAEATFLSSLRDFCAGGARTPAMNRWAIFGRPCGTGLDAPQKHPSRQPRTTGFYSTGNSEEPKISAHQDSSWGRWSLFQRRRRSGEAVSQ